MNIEKLKQELEEINKQKIYVMKELSRMENITEYHLTVKKKNGCYQLYYKNKEGKIVYIPTSQRGFAEEIAQKSYYKKLIKVLNNQETTLANFIKKYDPCGISDVYKCLYDGKKKLIKPLIASDEEYIEKWKSKYIAGQNDYKFETSYTTNKGEEVRSKSEKILADLFNSYGINYVYEPEIILYNGSRCYPDFVLLNLRERKTIYWEHLGLLSNVEYADKNLEKLARYEKSRIVLGDNLILSTEANGIGLDLKLIDEKIKRYLV